MLNGLSWLYRDILEAASCSQSIKSAMRSDPCVSCKEIVLYNIGFKKNVITQDQFTVENNHATFDLTND